MIELNEEDYQPLDTFRLKWRWTDVRWNLLPPDVLVNIRPLAKVKAREIYEKTLGFYPNEGFMHGSYELMDKMEVEDKDVQEVRDWLVSNISELEEPVVASWSPEDAVVTTAAIFCDYWDDFCYPSSDDVSFLPFSEEWLLFYSHEEVFFFGHHHQLC